MADCKIPWAAGTLTVRRIVVANNLPERDALVYAANTAGVACVDADKLTAPQRGDLWVGCIPLLGWVGGVVGVTSCEVSAVLAKLMAVAITRRDVLTLVREYLAALDVEGDLWWLDGRRAPSVEERLRAGEVTREALRSLRDAASAPAALSYQEHVHRLERSAIIDRVREEARRLRERAALEAPTERCADESARLHRASGLALEAEHYLSLAAKLEGDL